MPKKKTINILEKIKGKPSIALEYMVKGLIKQSKRKTFQILMRSWGAFDESSIRTKKGFRKITICYGCAATCTIQALANKNISPKTANNRYLLGFQRVQLTRFEQAINQAREGDLQELFDFCQVENMSYDEVNYKHWSDHGNWHLSDDTWRKQLPKIRKYIKYLKKHKL